MFYALDFYLLEKFQTGCGAHAASYSKGTAVLRRGYSNLWNSGVIALPSYIPSCRGQGSFNFLTCLCQLHVTISRDLLVTHTAISPKIKHISLSSPYRLRCSKYCVKNFCIFGRSIATNMSPWLSPWSIVLLQNPTGTQLVKKFSEFCGTQSFITAFTYIYPEPDQSNPCHLHQISWRLMVILSSHLRLVLLSGFFLSCILKEWIILSWAQKKMVIWF